MRFASDAPSPVGAALKAGQLLVKVRAASINPVDYKLPAIPVVSWTLGDRPVAQDVAGVVHAVY